MAGLPRVATLLLPRRDIDPLQAVLRRVAAAIGLLLLMSVLVWVDREGYTDLDDDVSFLDAFYYATVSASTTGFGEIAPDSDRARLVNVFVVTPIRVLFIGLLIGSTVEVLTRTGRERLRITRWQRDLDGHTVIVGFGTKGKAAAANLLDSGRSPGQLVAVTTDPEHEADAAELGLVVVAGDGSRDDVLRSAVVDRASQVVVAVPTDAAAVLITLTARRLNPTARVVAAARASENTPLLRASGADTVILSAEAAGRLLAVTAQSPRLGDVYADLLTPREGLELVERGVTPGEVGQPARALADLVVAVLRAGVRVDQVAGTPTVLEADDRLVVVRQAA